MWEPSGGEKLVVTFPPSDITKHQGSGRIYVAHFNTRLIIKGENWLSREENGFPAKGVEKTQRALEGLDRLMCKSRWLT